MGCSYKHKGVNTKCCFDCKYTHCPYMCYGLINKKMHKECDYYIEKEYKCVEEERDKNKGCF